MSQQRQMTGGHAYVQSDALIAEQAAAVIIAVYSKCIGESIPFYPPSFLHICFLSETDCNTLFPHTDNIKQRCGRRSDIT